MQWTLFDLIYAVRAWIRQLRFHRGVLRCVPESNIADAGTGSSWSAINVRSQRGGPVDAAAFLSDSDFVKFTILSHPRFHTEMTNTELRRLLKNKIKTDAKSKINGAIRDLVALGCLNLIREEEAPTRGHPVISCAKKPWSEFQGNRAILDFLGRIGVDYQSFP